MKAFVVLSRDFKNKEQDEMIKELQDYVIKKTRAWMSPRKVSTKYISHPHEVDYLHLIF